MAGVAEYELRLTWICSCGQPNRVSMESRYPDRDGPISVPCDGCGQETTFEVDFDGPGGRLEMRTSAKWVKPPPEGPPPSRLELLRSKR